MRPYPRRGCERLARHCGRPAPETGRPGGYPEARQLHEGARQSDRERSGLAGTCLRFKTPVWCRHSCRAHTGYPRSRSAYLTAVNPVVAGGPAGSSGDGATFWRPVVLRVVLQSLQGRVLVAADGRSAGVGEIRVVLRHRPQPWGPVRELHGGGFRARGEGSCAPGRRAQATCCLSPIGQGHGVKIVAPFWSRKQAPTKGDSACVKTSAGCARGRERSRTVAFPRPLSHCRPENRSLAGPFLHLSGVCVGRRLFGDRPFNRSRSMNARPLCTRLALSARRISKFHLVQRPDENALRSCFNWSGSFHCERRQDTGGVVLRASSSSCAKSLMTNTLSAHSLAPCQTGLGRIKRTT